MSSSIYTVIFFMSFFFILTLFTIYLLMVMHVRGYDIATVFTFALPFYHHHIALYDLTLWHFIES